MKSFNPLKPVPWWLDLLLSSRRFSSRKLRGVESILPFTPSYNNQLLAGVIKIPIA